MRFVVKKKTTQTNKKKNSYLYKLNVLGVLLIGWLLTFTNLADLLLG